MRERIDYAIKTLRPIGRNLFILLKWLALATLVGFVAGGVSTLFAEAMTFVTAFRMEHTWLILLLPVGGIVIVTTYKLLHNENDKGTNLILAGIHSGDEVPSRVAPLIIFSTLVSHFFGASVGREGAALQLGGSLGSFIGKIIHLDEQDRKVMIMCGMSAAFAALFGTPMAAAIFAIEVVQVGIMYYAALVPCIFAALVASNFSASMGINPEAFAIKEIPDITILNMGRTVLLAIICAGVSVVFCMMLHNAGKYFKKYIENQYLRIIAGSALIILITIILGTDDYMGAGMNVIERAIEGEAAPAAFLLKMFLTALAIGCGFKGGEIVPTFFVGATLGCVVGQLIGLPASAAAAVGMVGMLCCVTNCPVASMLIAFELFGYEAAPFFLVCNAVGYLMSGYYGLYSEQTFTGSKYKFDSWKGSAH